MALVKVRWFLGWSLLGTFLATLQTNIHFEFSHQTRKLKSRRWKYTTPYTLQQSILDTDSGWHNTTRFWSIFNNHAGHTSVNECKDAPGKGLEGGMGGYRILSEKIVVSTVEPRPHYRLLCGIYTYSPNFDLARAAAITWGSQCDGFLAFSDETIPELGILDLAFREDYSNMWQKTRRIWKYIYDHYHNDFDYFHLGGDDMYVIVPNLRAFLAAFDPKTPVHAGQWIRQRRRPFIGGGPGYTVSQAALSLFMKQYDTCFPNATTSAEDRLISQCLSIATDTRDSKGEQRYHDGPPQQIFAPYRGKRFNFHGRAVAYWESLALPNTSTSEEAWKPTETRRRFEGLEHASSSSVSFHKIRSPEFMARIHALLYTGVCSSDTSSLVL